MMSEYSGFLAKNGFDLMCRKVSEIGGCCLGCWAIILCRLQDYRDVLRVLHVSKPCSLCLGAWVGFASLLRRVARHLKSAKTAKTLGFCRCFADWSWWAGWGLGAGIHNTTAKKPRFLQFFCRLGGVRSGGVAWKAKSAKKYLGLNPGIGNPTKARSGSHQLQGHQWIVP